MPRPARPAHIAAVYHAAAAAFCLAALFMGIRTTSDLRWPRGTDLLRDIAQAQTMADGQWFADPYYGGENSWYPPLVPAVVAGVSRVLGSRVPLTHTRAGAYLNLLAPVAFYVAVMLLFDEATALAALVAFLFLSTAPTWAAATYTPWLYASTFAIAPFFAALALLVLWTRRGGAWTMVAAGGLTGLTFLAHSAPAHVLALVVAAAAILRWAEARGASERWQVARHVLFAAGTGLVVALPYLLPLALRYGLRIRNYAPLLWNDPSLTRAAIPAFLRAAVRPDLVSAMTAVGVATCVSVRNRKATLLFWVCLAVSLALFIVTAWIRSPLGLSALDRLPLAPSHHYLRYVRACGAVLAGLGLVWVLDAALAVVRRVSAPVRDVAVQDRRRALATVIVCAAIAVIAWPRYTSRVDFVAERAEALETFNSPDFVEFFRWIRFSTQPSAVFLTTLSAGETIVGPAGRKVVAVGKFFSSPYVDWTARTNAQEQLWQSLAEDRCEEFSRAAAAGGVSFVMLIAGRTPAIRAGRCGLEPTSFRGSALQILHVPSREPAGR